VLLRSPNIVVHLKNWLQLQIYLLLSLLFSLNKTAQEKLIAAHFPMVEKFSPTIKCKAVQETSWKVYSSVDRKCLLLSQAEQQKYEQ